MIKFRRHGDCNFHEITKEEFEKAQGKTINHNGSYVVARGEATGSTHTISVKNKNNLKIKETENGEHYISLLEEALIIHTTDHETIKISPAYYIHIPEREIDHFMDVERKVVD